MPGTEDFDRLPPRGDEALVVSSTERRVEATSVVEGALVLVDLETDLVEPVPILGRDACTFRPHGLSTVQRHSGVWEVFVIVHHVRADAKKADCHIDREDEPERLDSVERYRWQDDGLHFVERLSDPLMTNINDVYADPDGRLWVSNNPPWTNKRTLALDMLLGRRRGQVLLYRPIERRWSVAVRRMLYPNGVMVDETGEHLLVTGARGKLRLHRLDGVGESMEIARRGRARGALDNLLRGDEAWVWTTGHPNLLAFVRHAKDATEAAPTEVFRVRPHPRRSRRLQTERVLRVDDGRVDAGSVAQPVGDALVIGQVFESGVMVCGQ